MLKSYYTVKLEGSEEINIQKSRFIGYVRRCETEQEAQDFIQEIKGKHRDANHNCSAYMIGEHDLIQKASDDGEPSGTAGVPMLEVLKRKGLKDTAIVVTRYFGGTKLGAGGLIRAYSGAASAAIEATGIVKRQLMQEIVIKVDYKLLGKLENAVRNSVYHLQKVNYLENVELVVYVESGQEDTFKIWIIDLTGDQAEIAIGKTSYLETSMSP
ncbi:YigZ family protein [Thalassobacillus pellis]|uniref:YigZ family protein n=1 Tax=Thalassobacillus pellis TaxID=748008 RepID=UPI001960B384|nr:YigZ family protein [Thalassobacillus pellis]MBM7551444.1 putative YigZ family protein [Thalassobacillus pellis]